MFQKDTFNMVFIKGLEIYKAILYIAQQQTYMFLKSIKHA